MDYINNIIQIMAKLIIMIIYIIYNHSLIPIFISTLTLSIIVFVYMMIFFLTMESIIYSSYANILILYYFKPKYDIYYHSFISFSFISTTIIIIIIVHFKMCLIFTFIYALFFDPIKVLVINIW